MSSFHPSKKRAVEQDAVGGSAAATTPSSLSVLPPLPTTSRLTTPNSSNNKKTRTMATLANTTTTTTKTPETGFSSLLTALPVVRNPFTAPSTSTTTSSFPLLCLQHQVESLQAELEHERSLHLLDQKRAEQARLRLEKQLDLAVQEAHEATQSLHDFTRESHKMANQLRAARSQALDELRACQMQQLLSFPNCGNGDGENDESAMVKFWEEKCSHLEEELARQQENEQQLRLEMQEIQRDIGEKIQAQRAENKQALETKAANATVAASKILEEAPLAVLQELNAVRLQLANAQRGERQALRRVDELQQRHTSLIHEREQALLSCRRLPIVEQELTVLRRDYETLLAQHAAWQRLEQELVQATTASSGVATSARKSSGGTTSTTCGSPPDMSTIERFLREAKNRVVDLERQKQTLHDECQQLRQANLPLQKELWQIQQEQRDWSRERRQMQAQLETSRRQVQQAEVQQAIYQRETVELQNLIKTCDNLPFAATTTNTVAASTPGTSVFALTSPKGDHYTSSSIKTLELTLSTKRQELDLALQEKERLNKENVELSQELETIKTKFGKLRDALLTERSKAQEAEQRANAAEALAGKGSFDPETTRVLHFQETPLATTLKEEIQVLQRQLELAKNAAAAPSSSSKKSLSNSASKSMSVDAEKLNKRLKENFKEQIALFREGVYLMTGFKVDMLPGTDRPTFRVRSVYAEREEDHLLLKWPKPSLSSGSASAAAADSSSVKSLDVLNTDFAKNLTNTSSYEYMTKFSSLPAFLAAVQLSLFEKQTVMIS